MSLMQRTKGKVFEREVARTLRGLVAVVDGRYTVQRASQAERAYRSDLFFEPTGMLRGGMLPALWLELTHAENPNVLEKLDQAEEDAERAGGRRFPFVVWRRNRTRTTQVTGRLDKLMELVQGRSDAVRGYVVTLDLVDFMDVLDKL